MNFEGLFDCFNGLWGLFRMREQIIAFELSGVMFPRCMGNCLSMKIQALVLFSSITSYSALNMIYVRPKEILGQEGSVWNDHDSKNPEGKVESGPLFEDPIPRGSVRGSFFLEQNAEKDTENRPADHEGTR